jgi:hypothetical protein
MLKLALQSETLQNGKTTRNNKSANPVVEIPPTTSKKRVIDITFIVSRNCYEYNLSMFSKIKLL